MFHDNRSQSTRTGFACCLITANALEIIVKSGIITSSFFLISNAFIAISSAAVPLDTAIEYLRFINFEKFFSKYRTFPYPQFKADDNGIVQKEQCIPSNIEIATRTGWSSVKRLIRHQTRKAIYRVWTSSGIVEVTEDHSLLLADNTCIKPTELIANQHVLMTNPISTEISKSLFYNKEKWKGLWQIRRNKIFFHACTDLIYMAYIYFRFIQIYPASVFVFEDSGTTINLTNSENVSKGLVYRVEKLEEPHDFVYDVETVDGSFHCGLGDLVVKNTDSIYVHFPKFSNSADIWKKAKRTETQFLPLFPPPMRLMSEDKIYKNFFDLRLNCQIIREFSKIGRAHV